MPNRCSRLIPGATLVALAILVAGVETAVLAAADVRVHSKVQAVAHMAGPASIELEPGESRQVVIQVAANFPWKLSVSTANPAITAGQPESEGRPGGFKKPGNTIKVLFRCDPDAPGPQAGAIEYRIERL